MPSAKTTPQSEIIPRLYMKLVPLQIVMVIIGGVNAIIDNDFGVSEDNRIDITIHSMDEVISLSEQVWEFCKKHGISDRRQNCSSLCTEELAGNIIRHGFMDGKRHSIDIRVSCVNEDIVICFKDDGVPFNPEEASRLFDLQGAQVHSTDAFHNIGLHLVSRISRSMTYQNTFGLNILTIVV